MIILPLILLPLASGLIAFVLHAKRARRFLWFLTALAHLVLTLLLCITPGTPALNGWLSADSLAKIFNLITSLLFFAASCYGLFYLPAEEHEADADSQRFMIFRITREAFFTGFLLVFLSSMSLVVFAQHMGILWIAVEATTLASAPLIYFHKHHKSLEAAWKYLMVCSVGIALALLGIYFLAVAASLKSATPVHLSISELIKHAGAFHPTWLKAAFLLVLVGFGTKMGLVPMHTWLPEAHSESPSLVSALLSGALLNCSFLAILRMYQVMTAAGLAGYAGEILVIFGLVSMAAAAFLLISKREYKRMLAYSSIENMGILAVGAGLGASAGYGSLLHAMNHSLVKAALFLIAGNILLYYKNKKIHAVKGLLKSLPVSGIIWLAGFLVITGTPPAGLFFSKWIILKESVLSGNILIPIVFLAALVISFIAIARIVFKMLFSEADPIPGGNPVRKKEHLLSVAPSLVLIGLAIWLGIWIPDSLDALLKEAADLLGGV